jgi:hypothetical protein
MFIWEYDNLIHIKKIEIIFKNKFKIKQIMKDEIEKKNKNEWKKKEREIQNKNKNRCHLLHYLYTLTLLDVKGKDK